MKRHTKSLIDLIGQLDFTPRIGAEIGVWTGHNAAALLGAFPELRLYGVDDYRGCPSGKITGEEAYEQAWLLLLQFNDRYNTTRLESQKASSDFSPEYLDFIFIDASHDYESVKADIALWAPKVRQGGLIAGHDYSSHHKGVKRAVNEAYGDQVQVAPGKVWWVIKE